MSRKKELMASSIVLLDLLSHAFEEIGRERIAALHNTHAVN